MNYYGTNDTDIETVDAYDNAYFFGGNDLAIKSTGSGWVHGGSGTDWLSMYHSPFSVVVDMNAQTVTSGGSSLDFKFTGFEKIIGSNKGNKIYGADAAETLVGGAGYDQIRGGGGNDVIQGRGGSDRLEGGAGYDELDGGAGFGRIRQPRHHELSTRQCVGRS